MRKNIILQNYKNNRLLNVAKCRRFFNYKELPIYKKEEKTKLHAVPKFNLHVTPNQQELTAW